MDLKRLDVADLQELSGPGITIANLSIAQECNWENVLAIASLLDAQTVKEQEALMLFVACRTYTSSGMERDITTSVSLMRMLISQTWAGGRLRLCGNTWATCGRPQTSRCGPPAPSKIQYASFPGCQCDRFVSPALYSGQSF